MFAALWRALASGAQCRWLVGGLVAADRNATCLRVALKFQRACNSAVACMPCQQRSSEPALPALLPDPLISSPSVVLTSTARACNPTK